MQRHTFTQHIFNNHKPEESHNISIHKWKETKMVPLILKILSQFCFFPAQLLNGGLGRLGRQKGPQLVRKWPWLCHGTRVKVCIPAYLPAQVPDNSLSSLGIPPGTLSWRLVTPSQWPNHSWLQEMRMIIPNGYPSIGHLLLSCSVWCMCFPPVFPLDFILTTALWGKLGRKGHTVSTLGM